MSRVKVEQPLTRDIRKMKLAKVIGARVGLLMAKQQVMKSGDYAYAHRRLKRDFRKLWIRGKYAAK